jgi:hypothetical protein
MATIFLVFNRFPRMLWVSLKAPTSLCGTSMFTKCYIPCYSLANRSKYFLRRQFHRDQYNINITFCWHIFQIWQIILSKGSTPDTITATKQFYKIVFALKSQNPKRPFIQPFTNGSCDIFSSPNQTEKYCTYNMFGNIDFVLIYCGNFWFYCLASSGTTTTDGRV